MFDFLLQSSLFLSFGVLIYIISRAVPRIEDINKNTHTLDFFDKLLGKLPLKKIDAKINNFFEKILRKTKIVFLKADNFINSYLNRVKKNTSISLDENKIKTEIIDKNNEKSE